MIYLTCAAFDRLLEPVDEVFQDVLILFDDEQHFL